MENKKQIPEPDNKTIALKNDCLHFIAIAWNKVRKKRYFYFSLLILIPVLVPIISYYGLPRIDFNNVLALIIISLFGVSIPTMLISLKLTNLYTSKDDLHHDFYLIKDHADKMDIFQVWDLIKKGDGPELFRLFVNIFGIEEFYPVDKKEEKEVKPNVD